MRKLFTVLLRAWMKISSSREIERAKCIINGRPVNKGLQTLIRATKFSLMTYAIPQKKKVGVTPR